MEDQKTQRNSTFITGMQVAWMIYDHLKISDTDGTAPGPPPLLTRSLPTPPSVVQSRLVSGQTCRNQRKKWFGCATLKTLKMPEESSASFVSCERDLSHRCLCQTLARRFKRTIKSGVGQEKWSLRVTIPLQQQFGILLTISNVRNTNLIEFYII